jgi:chromate transporter
MAAPVSLRMLAGYFLRLGTFGFGGPIALTAAMQRDLVVSRRWITDAEYKEGLALAQLAPGPLAAQLAIYIGWVRWSVLGATVVGLTFVGPSLVMVLLLSALYLKFGGLAWMQGAFYGIGAAVIAIVARGAGKLLGSSVGRDPILWLVVLANAAVVAGTEKELLWVIALSGAVVLLVREVTARSRASSMVAPVLVPWWWLVSGLHGPATTDTLARLLGFFAKAAVVVFGSGLAVVPYIHGGVVNDFGWLTERQFLDAVAVSMITPGPVVITVAFIGYLVAGPVGGLAAATGMFLPTYLAVIVGAPWFQRVTASRRLRAVVHGVTAAATGAIVGSVVVLGRRALIDVPTCLIAATTLLLLVGGRRVPEPLLIVAAGIAGILVQTSGASAQAPADTHGELHVVADVPLPGPPVRFDYQSLDDAAGVLYISHMNAGEVIVFDTRARKVLGIVGGMPRVTGVLVVPQLHRLYASVAGLHRVAIIDTRTLTLIAMVGRIGFPDGIVYAPEVKKIFVSDESGGAELVIDATRDRALDTIPLGGEAGNSIYDSVSKHILVAVQTRDEVVAIDPGTDRLVGRYRLAGAARPHGLALDAARRLLFVADETNGNLLVVDLRTMQTKGRHRVGNDPDVLAFDPGQGRLYVGAESGRLTVLEENGDSLARIASIDIPHAHTVSVSPSTHLIYLPLADVGHRPVLRILEPEKGERRKEKGDR